MTLLLEFKENGNNFEACRSELKNESREKLLNIKLPKGQLGSVKTCCFHILLCIYWYK